MRLGAALIVRDAADDLDRCLASIRGLVDQVVVVDTGSVDGTPSVAERHGAVVDHVPWRGDFATPRNRSLDLLETDWVLYIDADEAVEGRPDALLALRSLLAAAHDHVAFRVRFVPRVGWTAYHEYRLWRHRPDIRFAGLIHESIVGAIGAAAAAEDLRIGTTDVLTIQHFGYEGDQRHKFARDEPMLRAQLARDPERIFLYDHLARIHEATGDAAGAVEWWTRGVERVRARPSAHPDDRLVYVNLIVHRVVRGDRSEDLGALVDDARDRFPGIPSLEFAAGTLAFAREDPAGAARAAEWLVALTPAEIEATGSSYDGRVVGEWAWNLLGLSRFALGDAAGAAEAFARAEAAAPQDPAYRVRRRLAEARASGTAR